jgi:hypothetical protein
LFWFDTPIAGERARVVATPVSGGAAIGLAGRF